MSKWLDMSHSFALGWEMMQAEKRCKQEARRRKEKARQEWNARRQSLWFWDLPFFDRVPAPYGAQPAPYDPGGIGVMG